MNRAEDDFEILEVREKGIILSRKQIQEYGYNDEGCCGGKTKARKKKYDDKIQELAYGGLDAETENKIRNCAKEVTKEKTVTTKKTRKFSPLIGTKITKEYRDKIHEVMVVNEGFSYEGTVYKSLPAIATKIAGTKWNGLKFFGVSK